MLNVKDPAIEIVAGSVDDERAAEIYRNLSVLYGTQTGEQALDRDFGIDINAVSAPQARPEKIRIAR